MNLSEISLAFKGNIGEVPGSFKEFLIKLNLLKDKVDSGITITNANDYILRDIEILLNKALINLGAADLLIKQGYFHWGYVSSYYSSFYSVMALNRIKLNFNTWTNAGIKCRTIDYLNKELNIKSANNSSGSHQAQFNKFYENYSNFRTTESIDRFWTLGIRDFRLRPEVLLRDDINYSIENYYYYELSLDVDIFEKIIVDNKHNPSSRKIKVTEPINYSILNLELALSRIRILTYILNYMANSNLEYKSYFIKRCNQRSFNMKLKYAKTSKWLMDYLEEWLKFTEIETDDILS